MPGMEYYPVMWGLFHKPWNEDPVIKQPVCHGSSLWPGFSWLNWVCPWDSSLPVFRFQNQPTITVTGDESDGIE